MYLLCLCADDVCIFCVYVGGNNWITYDMVKKNEASKRHSHMRKPPNSNKHHTLTTNLEHRQYEYIKVVNRTCTTFLLM